jgi:hypothetical protein
VGQCWQETTPIGRRRFPVDSGLALPGFSPTKRRWLRAPPARARRRQAPSRPCHGCARRDSFPPPPRLPTRSEKPARRAGNDSRSGHLPAEGCEGGLAMLMANRSDRRLPNLRISKALLKRPSKRKGDEDARKSIRARGDHHAPFTEAGYTDATCITSSRSRPLCAGAGSIYGNPGLKMAPRR